MMQDFFDQFQAASFIFAKFDLAELQNFLVLQQIFLHVQAQICSSTLQFLIFDVSEKMPFYCVNSMFKDLFC